MAYTPIMPNMKLSAQDMGVPDYMKALQSGLQGSQMAAETVMKPQSLAEALLQAQLKNAHDRTINKYLDEQQRSEIAHRNAQTGEIPLMNQIRQMQLQEAQRKEKLLQENPYYGATGDQGKIGMLLYMQQHPEMFGRQQGGQQSANDEQQPPQEQNWMDMLRQNQSSLNVPMRAPEQQSQPAQPNYIDDYRKSILESLKPKESAYQGPAREARDLERLKNEVGENSPVYKQAQELARQKADTTSALNAQRLRRAGGLKPGETEVKNNEGEVIGISKDFTPAEAKEEKGRIFFNYTYPKILQATSYYSGQGSIERFANDAAKYKTDKKAQQRIDNYRAALKSIGPGAVKENATVGGANTNQVYNRLISTLNSSDLPKKVDEIVKKYGLPKEAELRAGLKFQSWLNEATNASKKIPARHIQYLGGDKKGHIYNPETKSLDEVLVSPDHWDEFTKAGGY